MSFSSEFRVFLDLLLKIRTVVSERMKDGGTIFTIFYFCDFRCCFNYAEDQLLLDLC